jgi:hypothetical protein
MTTQRMKILDFGPLHSGFLLSLRNAEDGQANFSHVDGIDERSDKYSGAFDRDQSVTTIGHSLPSFCGAALNGDTGLAR